jgi:hypothetical protein
MVDEDVSLIVHEIEKSLRPRQNDARKVSDFLRPYLRGNASEKEHSAQTSDAPNSGGKKNLW